MIEELLYVVDLYGLPIVLFVVAIQILNLRKYPTAKKGNISKMAAVAFLVFLFSVFVSFSFAPQWQQRNLRMYHNIVTLLMMPPTMTSIFFYFLTEKKQKLFFVVVLLIFLLQWVGLPLILFIKSSM